MSGFIQSGRFGAAGITAPTAITGCVLWFDFADTATITSSGGIVSSVADKGSAGRTMAEVPNGPTTNSVTQNGHNVLVFDGTNDQLRLSGVDSITWPQPITLTLVAKIDTRTANDHLTDLGPTAGQRLLVSGDVNWRFYAGATSIDSGVTADTSWHTITVVFNGASSIMRLDGTQIASGNPGANGLGAGWAIGASSGAAAYTASKFGEVVWHDTALGTSDLQSLEAYLKAKWNTP